jgi:hypothetical protein
LGLVPAARSCSEWPTDKNTSIKWKKKEKKRRKDEKNEKTYLGPSSWYSQIAAGVMSSLQLKNMLINEINNIYIYIT